MTLTNKEVEHIAHLARLGLSEKEVEKYATQLSSILEYVNQLKEVDTQGVVGTAQVTGLENITRQDEVEPVGPETIKKLIHSAPDQEDNLIKTKSVF